MAKRAVRTGAGSADRVGGLRFPADVMDALPSLRVGLKYKQGAACGSQSRCVCAVGQGHAGSAASRRCVLGNRSCSPQAALSAPPSTSDQGTGQWNLHA